MANAPNRSLRTPLLLFGLAVALSVLTLAAAAAGFHFGVQPDEMDPQKLADAKIATNVCSSVMVAGALGTVVSALCAAVILRRRH